MSGAKIALASLFLSSIVFCLSGCQKPAATPTNSQGARTQTIDLMPEGSKEISRRHVFNEYGQEVETHINYRNKEVESTYFRDDGTRKEEVATFENGSVKSRKVYDDNGQTVLEGKEVRADATVKWIIEHQADGSAKTTTYWYDGAKIFSVEISKANGSYAATYYRKNGSISGTKSGKSRDNITTEEFFDRSQKLVSHVDWLSKSRKAVTIFNRDGTPLAKATMAIKSSGDWPWWSVRWFEEYDSQGKVRRKYIMDDQGYSVVEIQDFNDDGSKSVRTPDEDGRVKQEETFDSSGKSIKVEKYKRQEGPWMNTNLPYYWQYNNDYLPDLQRNWQNQEDYPYYRDYDN